MEIIFYYFCVCGMIKSRVNIQIGFFSEMRICVLIFEQWNILMWSDLKYLFSIEGGTNWFCYHSCVCLLGPLESKLRLSLSGSLDAILEKSLNTSLNVTSPETKKMTAVSPLIHKSDKVLISLYNLSLKSNVQVTRMKEMISN